MKTIAKLIEAALAELCERGIDGIDDEMSAFQAECEIEYGLPVSIVTICGFYIFLAFDWRGDSQWHAYHSMRTEFVECLCCEVQHPSDQGRTIEEQFFCDGCVSPFVSEERRICTQVLTPKFA